MIIVIQCPDKVGLVAAISGVVAAAQLNIVSMREHVDTLENQFFMRIEVDKFADSQTLEDKLKGVLPAGAVVIINPIAQKR